jgi:hypothetical protein
MKSKQLFILTCFLLVFCSCSYIKYWPGHTIKKAKKEIYDVVIIPGYPYDGKKWNDVIKFRLLWAVYLYENELVKNFIFSGAAVHTPYNEGYIMALYAHKMGIPKENIFIEPSARHSAENVYFSIQIAKNMGFSRIAIATDPVQGFLLTYYTQRIRNDKIDFINIIPRYIREHKFADEPKIDKWLAFEDDFVALTEKENYWKRKKASLGLDIDYGVKANKYLKYTKWFRF